MTYEEMIQRDVEVIATLAATLMAADSRLSATRAVHAAAEVYKAAQIEVDAQQPGYRKSA